MASGEGRAYLIRGVAAVVLICQKAELMLRCQGEELALLLHLSLHETFRDAVVHHCRESAVRLAGKREEGTGQRGGGRRGGEEEVQGTA